MLPALLITPNPESFRIWTFANADDHVSIQKAIQTQKGYDLPVYDLLQAGEKDWNQWLFRHQQAHNDMNGTLGLVGQDLLELDPNNGFAVKAWLWQNYLEHLAVHQTLNV